MSDFLSGVGGSLVSGVLGIISNSKTNAANAEINRSNQRFQHAEAELAYRRQRQLIQEQNQYNSYSNQRQLMENAGYNPYNLVGGTAGTAVSSSSTNAPQAGSPSAVPMQQLDSATLGALSDAALKAAQIKNINADTDKKHSETNLTNTQQAYVESQKEYQDEFNRIYKTYGEYEKILGVEQTEFQNANIKAQTTFQEVQTNLARYDLNTLKPAEYANIVADSANKSIDSALKEAQTAKTDAERISIIKRLGAELALLRAQALHFSASAKLFQDQTIGQGISNELWGVNGLFRKQAGYEFLATKTNYHQLNYEYRLFEKHISDFDKAYQLSLKSQIASFQKNLDFNERRNMPVFGYFFDTLDEISHVWSGSGAVQLGTGLFRQYQFNNRNPIGFKTK